MNTTTDTRYNGWTNYATWRVNLEVFDGFNAHEYFDDGLPDTYELSKWLAEYADDCVTGFSRDSSQIAVDLARAFLADVNWYEIAEHILDDIKAEET